MPDPQKDIAPIIEPAAPLNAFAGPDYVLPTVLGVGSVLLLAALALIWRKRAPFRSLRKLAQEHDPVDAANTLAALIKKHRIETPSDWQSELDRLRFGPPVEDAADRLVRLCRQAEKLLKAR